ncbi:hypothetical protein [Pseudomonas sp. KNUC1026]|uniref:hypothetical protein n=1 Tax=Pseudomonas sp. KNUC1026 TaxID=2893890 RepID=UPI001F1D15DC|nr:hypothetical protein [Pseudomonas sp. KNUC1026]UFH51323.1 hypothetical protein LN139_10070 [Pseudomonas sp. KNUC1026]
MPEADNHPHWQRNLAVCVFGSFTTLVAMTLLLPFLPLYVAQLGVQDPAAVVQWSGVAFGATFFLRPSPHRCGAGWATATGAS